MITLTGIDEHTDLDALMRMLDNAGTYPVEIGVLWTTSPEGRNRYPSGEFIAKAADRLGSRLAVHICGKGARTQAAGYQAPHDVLRKVGRIQVNGNVEANELAIMMGRFDRQLFITQHPANAELLLFWGDGRHQILIDGSGGRGIKPEKWVVPNTSKRIGFAGGLSPETLSEEISKMPPHAWVDLETNLRDGQDWFSIERAAACINIMKKLEPWL